MRRAVLPNGRDPTQALIELTPNGQRLARRLIAKLEAQTATLRASWSDERKQQAVELLDEISNALETSQAGADSTGAVSRS